MEGFSIVTVEILLASGKNTCVVDVSSDDNKLVDSKGNVSDLVV